MVTDWKRIQAECHFRHKTVALVTYIFSTEHKIHPPVATTILIYTKPRGESKRPNQEEM